MERKTTKKVVIVFVAVMAMTVFAGMVSSNENLDTNSGKTVAAQGIKATHPYPCLPPDCIDIAYDDNVDHGWGYGIGNEDYTQHLRVLFTPPSEAEGGLVREIRACFFAGDTVTFHVNLIDVDTSYQVASPPFVISEDGWAVLDVSSMGFITEGDFYAELIAESGGKAVYADETPPIDDRSQVFYGSAWHTVEEADHFIRAVVSTGEQSASVSITTDRFKYSTGDTMIRHLEIDNPTANPVTFNWYLGVPQFAHWGTIASAPIPAGFSYSGDSPFPVGDWGPAPFGMVWYVELTDGTGEVLDSDAATCTYSQGVGVSKTSDALGAIKESIRKTGQ